DFPKESWPDNIELLYYSFHLMITLGTIFIALMACAGFQNLRGRLESSRGLLWVLMLAFPFPYIANTLGWMTTELGRQPWLVYGLFRTAEGHSKVVSGGDTVFTLIGFVGLYLALGVLFLFLVIREIRRGPGDDRPAEPGEEVAGGTPRGTHLLASCSSSTWRWTAATSAPECSTGWWRERPTNAVRSSPRSGRSGPGTKCGWWVSAALCSRYS